MDTKKLFTTENEANQKGNPYFALSKVGDVCRGYFVRKTEREDTLKTPREDGKKQFKRVYTLLVPEGEEYEASAGGGKTVKIKGGELMDVYGRMQIEDGDRMLGIVGGTFETAKPGDLIGVQYSEQMKPTTKGFSGAKIQKPYDFKENNAQAIKEHAMSQFDPAAFGASDDVPFGG